MDHLSSDDDQDVPRERVFRPRVNFEVEEFVARFRLSPAECDNVLNVIGPRIAHGSGRNQALSERQQLLLTLRFLASNSHFGVLADAHGIDKSTVSRAVHRVVDAITDLLGDTIKFPDDVDGLPLSFFRKAGFPSVSAALDGTHIPIQAPVENEVQFVNRHHTHSINAMVACGPDLRVYYVSARWPGATNDSRVLRNSLLADRWNAGFRPFPGAVILGDSGYPCLQWLIPPILNPGTAAENRFNIAHKRTRRVIECCFGVAKKKFTVLSSGMRLDPAFAGRVVMACFILHNVCLTDLGDEDDGDEDEGIVVDVEGEEDAHRRQELVNFFA